MVVAAVLIDGAYFVKRFRAIEPHNAYNGKRAAELAWRYAFMHLSEKNGKSQLYRIFFYDCPPVEKKMHQPFSRTAVDFSKSTVFQADQGITTDDRMVRQLAQQFGVEATGFGMLAGIAGEIGQIHLGTQVSRGEGLRLFVASAGVGEEAVAGEQGANVKQQGDVVRTSNHVVTQRPHLSKTTRCSERSDFL